MGLILSPKSGRVLEVSAVIYSAVLLVCAYTILLGGLPYNLMVEIQEISKRNFETLKYCWISEGLGKPNDKLAFTTIYVLPALLKILGADLSLACLTLLTALWSLGGCSTYLLAKRFSKNYLAGLAAMLIYLGAATSLRGFWCSLDVSALYVLTLIILLITDEAYQKRKASYGFYAALTSTILSGTLVKLDNLAVLTFTVLAYFAVRIRRENVELKHAALFLTIAGASWLIMNAWWLAVPPSLNVENFNPLCVVVFPITALTLMLLLRIDKLDAAQALALIASAILLMDPREIISSNIPLNVLAIISVDVTLLVAAGLKRFSDIFSNYISISLVVGESGDKSKEYDLTKPLIFLLALGVVLYQGLTAPLLWASGLNIPEHYKELNSLITPRDHRILTIPVLTGGYCYNWSSVRFRKPVESLILDNPIIYGCEFTALNDLTGRGESWKILSALNVKFIVLHYDIIRDEAQTVDPRIMEIRLNYSFIVSPNLANGSVNVTSEDVKPILEDLGFIQLVNFNSEKRYGAEIRHVEEEAAQSKIHLYAYGESWISELANLNQTFSFAYILPRVANWLDYNYLEFWIKVNGSEAASIQIQDVFGRWALWQLNLKEHEWNLVAIRLNDATMDNGLDRSRVVAVVFSIHAPLESIVEAEVGGIFLDKGIIFESKPLELHEKLNQQLTVYRLRDEFELSKIYSVKEVLKSEGDIFKDFLKSEFDPRNVAYSNTEVEHVSYGELDYVEVEPTRYRVTVYNFQDRFLVILNEKFDSGWTLYVGEPNPIDILTGGGPRNVKHVKINGFLNGWYVEAGDFKPLTLTIVYRPQLLLEVLRVTSTVSAVSSFIILFFKKKAARMLKHI
ncbi:hypothetical protein KEJ25_08545, partial [Candidatus Bathyarchaeota archaeon]|nr:hypothetical protein [Candidatus Bathyarchaeota archaeon]